MLNNKSHINHDHYPLLHSYALGIQCYLNRKIKDDDDKCPYVPGQQIPVTTDPGQILHIDSNTATLLNNFAINHYIRTIVQVNISYRLLLNQLNQFSIKLVAM